MVLGWEKPLAIESGRPLAKGLARPLALESGRLLAPGWGMLSAIVLERPSMRGLGKLPMLLERLGVRLADRLRISFDME